MIDEQAVADPHAVRTLLLAAGRICYPLLEARAQRGRSDIALVRVEQLYPFPADELREVFKRYPRAGDLRWVQEEPANMGAWRNLRHRLEAIQPEGATLSLIARQDAPTPATGYYQMHVEQEQGLIERAFGAPAEPHSAPAADEPAASAAAPARHREAPAGARGTP